MFAAMLAMAVDSRWVELRRMGTDRVFIDGLTAPEKGKSGDLWVKIIHTIPRKSHETSQLWRYAISCQSRSVGTLTTVLYYSDRTAKRIDIQLVNAEFVDPAPDTLGEFLVNMQCAK